MLSPEAPYPLHGGGAYRTASLLHYFARLAPVDLILISDSGRPALVPDGLVRSQHVIALPRHRRDKIARYTRNALRAIRGAPPLIDRLSGLHGEIVNAIGGRSYDLGVIEHFWCAPYAPEMLRACAKTVLNLHNVESMLHERCAAAGNPLARLGHARFARASRELERKLLPRFSAILAPSDLDAGHLRPFAGGRPIITYPNALPLRDMRRAEPDNSIVFSGNFEYHPNIDAVAYFVREIWPQIRAADTDIRLLLVGRGESHVEHLIRHDPRIDTTGQVEDASIVIGRAVVAVAPLRAGSGTRIKILEAWAAGTPVVATSIAAEGLAAVHGDNCLIADRPHDFAEAVLRLVHSRSDRERIVMRARSTFEHNYTWNAAWDNLSNSLQVLEKN